MVDLIKKRNDLLEKQDALISQRSLIPKDFVQYSTLTEQIVALARRIQKIDVEIMNVQGQGSLFEEV